MGSKDCVGADTECVDTGYAFVIPTVVKFHFQIGSVDWLKHWHIMLNRRQKYHLHVA